MVLWLSWDADSLIRRQHHDAFSAFFFFTDPATPEIYTLSLHDALPIWSRRERGDRKSLPAWFDHPRHRRRQLDRNSTRLNSSHRTISYAVFCLKKKKNIPLTTSFRSVITAGCTGSFAAHPCSASSGRAI